jgi:ABC-type transport system substrate-binding protein
MTRTGEPDEQLFAQLIRDQLADVGIKVNIVSVDFATYLARQQRFEYQIQTVKYWIDPLWVYQLFHTEWIGKGAFTNNFQYSNPQFDKLLNQWLEETDPTKQVELLQKAGDILSRELPVIILYEVVWPNVLNKNFAGPDIPLGKFVFFDPLKDIYHVPSQPKTTVIQTPTVTQTQIAERTVFVTRTAVYTTTITQQETNLSMVTIPLAAGIIIAVAGILMGRRLGKGKS